MHGSARLCLLPCHPIYESLSSVLHTKNLPPSLLSTARRWPSGLLLLVDERSHGDFAASKDWQQSASPGAHACQLKVIAPLLPLLPCSSSPSLLTSLWPGASATGL
jgi:hypothetical protein